MTQRFDGERAPRPSAARRQRQDERQADRQVDQHVDRGADLADGESARKDPDQWVTGEESMTGPQASYLRTLSQEAGVEFDEALTKAEASRRIDELQDRTGRGRDH